MEGRKVVGDPGLYGDLSKIRCQSGEPFKKRERDKEKAKATRFQKRTTQKEFFHFQREPSKNYRRSIN